MIILYSIIFSLLALYIFSFFKSTDKRKEIQTALVNPKYISAINKIQLLHENNFIELKKIEDVWFINENSADKQKITEFLDNLSKIRKVYLLTDKIEKNNYFGFDEENVFKVRYFYSENDFEDLFFGKNDFAQTSRYFMSGKNTKVYELENDLDKYLNISEQSWSEALLISQNIFGNITSSDIQRILVNDGDNNNKNVKIITSSNNNWNTITQKILDLRHGGTYYGEFNSNNKNQRKVYSIKIELGNMNEIFMEFFSTDNEAEYIVSTNYLIFKNNKFYKTKAKISAWTYNKIKEITL